MICGHSTSTSLLLFKQKEPNIKKFYHVIFELFFEHAIFLCFISLIFLHFLFESSSLFHILAIFFFSITSLFMNT
jgi:hypothetical protein